MLKIMFVNDFGKGHFDENEMLITQAEFLARLTTGVFVEARWDSFSGTADAPNELSLELDD